ncbi:SIMPL domain-containing protein [Idiomarina sp.]|uniref:SIMPL domain-containing protein n=1 Tax=Idiomarina sp. TaxID=1874361 RepID=UPI0025BBF890|nr:SIMPL domain-containing protein [Idiomarina sp.]
MKHSDPFWKPTLLLTVGLALLMSFTAYGQTFDRGQQSGISVTGAASVSAVPDQASISFAIEQRGNKLSALKTQVDQYTTRLIDDLLDRDIPRDNIQSFQLSIYPQYETDNDGKREQRGFIVSRNIDVTLPSLALYDQIIDLAIAQGVTRVGQVRFEVSDQQQLYQQALQKAFENARNKAEFIATTAGLEIVSVMSVQEQSMARPVMFEMAAMDSRSKSPSLPGAQEIEARLNVVFSVAAKN